MSACRLLILVSALPLLVFAEPSVAVGSYVTELLPAGAITGPSWYRYTRPSVGSNVIAQVQNLYGTLCERTDLMSADVTDESDKRLVTFPDCPSPHRRALLSLSKDGVLSQDIVSNLYDSCRTWFSRVPSVTTTESSGTNVYPDWQSPLCRDIGLSFTSSGLYLASSDIYPDSLSRFGYPARRHDWIASALSNRCVSASVPFSASPVSQTDLDALYCSAFIPGYANLHYIDDVMASGDLSGVLLWMPLFSANRILHDLAGGNVSTLPTEGYLSYTGYRTEETIEYEFDPEALTNWLLQAHIGRQTASFEPSVSSNSSKSTFIGPLTPSSYVYAEHTPSTLAGSLTRVVRYDPVDAGASFVAVETGTTDLTNVWTHMTRTLYTEDVVELQTNLVFTSFPKDKVYTLNTRTRSNLRGHAFSSANSVFGRKPELFGSSRVTAFGKADVMKMVGSASRTESRVDAESGISATTDVSDTVRDGLDRLFWPSEYEFSGIYTSSVPLVVTVDGYPHTSAVKEYRTVICDTNGTQLSVETFAARVDGTNHYPRIRPGTNNFYPPDAASGEYRSYGTIPTSRTVTNVQTFSSSYPLLASGNFGFVSKTVEKPRIVCENRYRFSDCLPEDPPTALVSVGPSDDYVFGDDYDFDVFVDASYTGMADNPAKGSTRIQSWAVDIEGNIDAPYGNVHVATQIVLTSDAIRKTATTNGYDISVLGDILHDTYWRFRPSVMYYIGDPYPSSIAFNDTIESVFTTTLYSDNTGYYESVPFSFTASRYYDSSAYSYRWDVSLTGSVYSTASGSGEYKNISTNFTVNNEYFYYNSRCYLYDLGDTAGRWYQREQEKVHALIDMSPSVVTCDVASASFSTDVTVRMAVMDNHGGVTNTESQSFSIRCSKILYPDPTTNVFSTLQAAIEAVNPNGGTHAVTNRIPRIGIFPGTYESPQFFNKRPFYAGVVIPPYDINLVGLGKGVIIKRNGRYITGHYSIISETQTSTQVSVSSTVENVSFDLGTGDRIHLISTLNLINCEIYGTARFRDSGAFVADILYNCHLHDMPVSYYNGTDWSPRNRPPVFNGSSVYGSVVDLSYGGENNVALANDECRFENSFITATRLNCLHSGAITTDPVFIGSTVCCGQLLNWTGWSIRNTAATNCLFCITGIQQIPPYTVDNIMRNYGDRNSVIDPDTLRVRGDSGIPSRYGFQGDSYRYED